MRRLSTENFIHKSIKVHGDKYKYNNSVYINAKTKICISCPVHGEFWQNASHHIRGHGCPLCSVQTIKSKLSATTEDLIKRATKIHGSKYNYSKVEYVNAKTKVCIVCPEHGEFLQTPDDHLSGKGCKYCSGSVQFRPDLSQMKTPKGSRAVPLTDGKYALVDEEDYERVMEYTWGYTKSGYGHNSTLGRLHRFIMNCPKGMVVDHINHDTLDNRKSNLRVCTQQQNLMNMKCKGGTSNYKGVSWSNRYKKWLCQIKYNYGNKVIGKYTSEIEAARAYDEAAKKIQGRFAYLNFK